MQFKIAVSFNVLSGSKEGLLCDSVQSKSILENAIINNDECTGFFCSGSHVSVSVVSINPQRSQSICIPSRFTMKITNKQFSIMKKINGTALVVDAVHSIKKEFNCTGHYKIMCKMLTEVKGKEL